MWPDLESIESLGIRSLGIRSGQLLSSATSRSRMSLLAPESARAVVRRSLLGHGCGGSKALKKVTFARSGFPGRAIETLPDASLSKIVRKTQHSRGFPPCQGGPTAGRVIFHGSFRRVSRADASLVAQSSRWFPGARRANRPSQRLRRPAHRSRVEYGRPHRVVLARVAHGLSRDSNRAIWRQPGIPRGIRPRKSLRQTGAAVGTAVSSPPRMFPASTLR